MSSFSAPAADRTTTLRPVLGVIALATGIVNLTIGAGIFALPGVAAAQLGQYAWIAYVACALVMTPVLICFAVAGNRVSDTGGTYAYVRTAFGPFASFMSGILLWVSAVAASASVAAVFVDMFGVLAPAFTGTLARGVVLTLMYGVVMTVNVLGVRIGARTITGLTIAKVAPLIALVIAGVVWSVMRWTPPGPPPAPVVPMGGQFSMEAVGRAALVLIFAFVGIEVALSPSGEVRRPARTVPRAIGIALFGVTILYLALQATAQHVLGASMIHDRAVQAAPLSAVAARFAGPIGGHMLTVAALVSTFGYVFGDALASPRVLYALAAHGNLPHWLTRVHPVRKTPYAAVLVHSSIGLLLALTGTFVTLVVMASVAILVVYVLCCLAAYVLVRRFPNSVAGAPGDDPHTDRPLPLPLGPLIPALACTALVWLLAHAEWREYAAVGAAIVIAAVMYAGQRFRLRHTGLEV